MTGSSLHTSPRTTPGYAGKIHEIAYLADEASALPFNQRFAHYTQSMLRMPLPYRIGCIQSLFKLVNTTATQRSDSGAFQRNELHGVAMELLAGLFFTFPIDKSYAQYMNERGLLFAEAFLRSPEMRDLSKKWEHYNDEGRISVIRDIACLQDSIYSSPGFAFRPLQKIKPVTTMWDYADYIPGVARFNTSSKIWNDFFMIPLVVTHEKSHDYNEQLPVAFINGSLSQYSILYRQAELLAALRKDDDIFIHSTVNLHAYKCHPEERIARTFEDALHPALAAIRTGNEDRMIDSIQAKRFATGSGHALGFLQQTGPMQFALA